MKPAMEPRVALDQDDADRRQDTDGTEALWEMTRGVNIAALKVAEGKLASGLPKEASSQKEIGAREELREDSDHEATKIMTAAIQNRGRLRRFFHASPHLGGCGFIK